MKTRQPKQQRALATVEAVLDAVDEVIRRHGVAAVTTNRIAERAGVSIGSVYQYFPDKQAIFAALHDRHSEQIGRVVESTLVRHATSSLDELVGALVEAMIDAHGTDPRPYEVMREVPQRGERTITLAARLLGALRLAITSRSKGRAPHDLERKLFVLTNMIDALAHAAVLRRPPSLSLAAAKREAVRAVLAYLHA
jgi:AcrR family transcriptional regulator